jgi:hypothetical protein
LFTLDRCDNREELLHQRQQVNCPLIVKTKGREVKILIDESNYVMVSDIMIISDKIYNIGVIIDVYQ